ncbi:hypothetical protein Q5X70_02700 [Acinetobacter baumannii]|nr:hypothetical protein [Acinetobacter baumannii]
MVTKIKAPDISSIEFINKVLESRVVSSNRWSAFYKAIEKDLISSYERYIQEKGNPEIISTLDFKKYSAINDVELRKKTMINLYTTKQDAYITPILDSLRTKHNLLFCPFCGEEVIPSTLDHYLPKEKFPEYSICLVNLIPMCTKCQGKDAKGEKVLDINNCRIFLNPYYENVDKFLVLSILPPFNEPGFILNLKDIKDKSYYKLLASHVIELNIYDRFLNFARSKHISLLKLAKKNRQSGRPIKEIIQIYLDEKEVNSTNSWSAIYYRGVLFNPDFLNYLDREDLPEYI